MKKNSIIALLISLVLVVMTFSCGTVEEEGEETLPVVPVSEQPAEEPPVEEVFTEERFVQSLQDVLSAGSVDEALALFDTLPEDSADSYDLNYIQASLLISNGEYDKAEEIAGRLLESEPDNTDALMLRAVIAKATGNEQDKKQYINQILQADPYNSDANTELGNEYMLNKSWRLARECYRKAYISDSTNTEALAGFGKSSYYLGELEDAEDAFLDIIDRYPDDAFSWAYLAKLYSEWDRNIDAAECAHQAVICEPGYFDYWLDYGDYLGKLERNAEAEEAFSTAISLRPDYFLGYVYRGGLYDLEGKYELARQDYLKVAELRPGYYYIYESLAFLSWHDQDWAAAREWFQKAAAALPNDTSYPMLIALCMYHEGDTRAARDYVYKTVLKKFSNTSIEYAVMRLFYDNVADGTVATKVQNESDANRRGKMLFYLAQYYELKGKDNLAQKYYIAVNEMEAPMFIEVRLNDWALEQMMN